MKKKQIQHDDKKNNYNTHNSNIDNHNDINTDHKNGPFKSKSKSTKKIKIVLHLLKS